MANQNNDSRITFIGTVTNLQLRHDSYYYVDLVITAAMYSVYGVRTLPTTLRTTKERVYARRVYLYTCEFVSRSRDFSEFQPVDL